MSASRQEEGVRVRQTLEAAFPGWVTRLDLDAVTGCAKSRIVELRDAGWTIQDDRRGPGGTARYRLASLVPSQAQVDARAVQGACKVLLRHDGTIEVIGYTSKGDMQATEELRNRILSGLGLGTQAGTIHEDEDTGLDLDLLDSLNRNK